MRNLILILAFLLIGCKQYVEEDMTISIPTAVTLVTTNVTDDTQVFSEGSDYVLNDVVLYDMGETYPPLYIKTEDIQVRPFSWKLLIEEGDVIRLSSELYIAHSPVGLYTNRVIDDVYESPTYEQLLSQQQYTVGSFKFQGVSTGTYPSITYEVRVSDLSDTVLYTAPLYYVNTDRTELVAQKDSSLPLGAMEAIIYDNGYLYYIADRAYSVTLTSISTAFTSGTDTLDQLGFSYYSVGEYKLPFDDRNYSAASIATQMTYTVRGDVSFDTLALGRVKADSVTAVFKLQDGTQITSITRSIDRSIDSLDNIDGSTANVILYADQIMPINSTVEITLDITTGDVELGSIMLGQSLDAGFHDLQLRHGYKDFSTAEYDAWGNLDYVEKQRIATYNGNVDIVITDYDRIVRLFTFLGKKLVIVNGSKNKTTAPNSQTVFASTQLIGRFMTFNCRTMKDDGDIHPIANYDFTLEGLA